MATIDQAAIEWVKDQLENLQAQVDELEDELSDALDENAALKIQITRLMSDRSLRED